MLEKPANSFFFFIEKSFYFLSAAKRWLLCKALMLLWIIVSESISKALCNLELTAKPMIQFSHGSGSGFLHINYLNTKKKKKLINKKWINISICFYTFNWIFNVFLYFFNYIYYIIVFLNMSFRQSFLWKLTKLYL
jgi:hypothetical protein